MATDFSVISSMNDVRAHAIHTLEGVLKAQKVHAILCR